MGVFQPCDTCTEAPTTTPAPPPPTSAPNEEVDSVPLTENPPSMEQTIEEEIVPTQTDALPIHHNSAPLVLPDTNNAPAPEHKPFITEAVPPDDADLDEIPMSFPTTTAAVAAATALAENAANHVKKAIDDAASTALLTGVSEPTGVLKKPFSLTWVMYDAADPLGQLLALVTLSPVFIMVMYATLILFQRDLHIIFMVLGQLVNEVFNQILKRTIDQKRPDGADMEDAGMPSAHSQFMAFFATYVVLYTSNRMSKRREWEHKLAIGGVILLALLVFFSRIRLGYHSVAQVVVGAAVGAGTGILWYIVLENIAMPLFPTIASWDISKLLFIRDCSHIPDMVEFQYEAIQKKVKSKYHGM
ncbi:unnamed protein product [Aphanomyces euteiches]|uniref:Dolichyldiphosphatase n=1 Tax=Aphanomyces euteiches TaxID=100861 RepID=A0A6G0XWR1_9STRA|nr:hypothetical protein Ae201684_000585 [Aphanomyces euteiches]KAH9091773.1 hypothetical protein Ae201684P_011317 [Aphanomyces euteiches]KAH9155811.1 hypothetical protein AeRB84_002234 [Aphanomyces euteiches]